MSRSLVDENICPIGEIQPRSMRGAAEPSTLYPVAIWLWILLNTIIKVEIVKADCQLPAVVCESSLWHTKGSQNVLLNILFKCPAWIEVLNEAVTNQGISDNCTAMASGIYWFYNICGKVFPSCMGRCDTTIVSIVASATLWCTFSPLIKISC